MIIASLLREVDKGFFMDIGCNHPIHENNTFKLYEAGWCGMGIDANPSFAEDWSSVRPKDVFLNRAITTERKRVEFSIFQDSRLSSLDISTVERYKKRGLGNNTKTIDVEAITLDDLFKLIIEEYSVKEVHLLCVDIEGLDEQVILNTNFLATRPGLIVVECKNLSLLSLSCNKVVSHLINLNYAPISKTPLDMFFVAREKNYFDWIPRSMIEL